MSYKNYKEGTGVRARGDLSPNARPTEHSTRMTDDEMIRAADWMMSKIVEAEERGSSHVFVPVNASRRWVDTMLEVVNRGRSV